MLRVIFTHVYVIVMAVFIVMMGNILADNYGPTIIESISGVVDSADRGVNDVQLNVNSWNKKILD
mgnify:CR=1 FL=1